MAAEFKAGGPVALIKKYLLPAIPVVGHRTAIVRMIPQPDWLWLNSWGDAATDTDLNLILYTNPTSISALQAPRLLDLDFKCALEFTGQDRLESWVRGFLYSAGLLWAVEPGIEKDDRIALAHNRPMILTDFEWNEGYLTPDGPWSHTTQIDPKTYSGGVIRWYQGDNLWLPWYQGLDPTYVTGAVIPADYLRAA